MRKFSKHIHCIRNISYYDKRNIQDSSEYCDDMESYNFTTEVLCNNKSKNYYVTLSVVNKSLLSISLNRELAVYNGFLIDYLKYKSVKIMPIWFARGRK